jgi:hypothetical protein
VRIESDTSQWYHTAKILLHSRFLQRNTINPSSPLNDIGLRLGSHEICTVAASATVDLLAHLDRHHLLAQVSADIIHLLSLATLFEGELHPSFDGR